MRATAAIPSPRWKVKTDNHSLADKALLRRDVLKEAQLGPLRVLDLFAGEGNIWNEMRRAPKEDEDFEQLVVEKYTPIDAAAKQMGQIKFKITPRLIDALNADDGLMRYNVIDVDCYGEPWEIWRTILFAVKQKTVVFLTRGKVTYGAGRMPISRSAKKAMGIPAEWDVPGKIELMEHADRCQLLQPCETARIEFGYQTRLTRVDYFGVCVIPVVDGTPQE